MTGGVAVILGRTGKNFGAGMSGGLAYVYDPDRTLGRMANKDVDGDLFERDQWDVEVIFFEYGFFYVCFLLRCVLCWLCRSCMYPTTLCVYMCRCMSVAACVGDLARDTHIHRMR